MSKEVTEIIVKTEPYKTQYILGEVLNAEGYEISVVPPREGSTVTFKIQKAQNK